MIHFVVGAPDHLSEVERSAFVIIQRMNGRGRNEVARLRAKPSKRETNGRDEDSKGSESETEIEKRKRDRERHKRVSERERERERER